MTAATASGRRAASMTASPPPMQYPITPTAALPVRAASSSTAPLRSAAASATFMSIIAAAAASGSVTGTFVPS